MLDIFAYSWLQECLRLVIKESNRLCMYAVLSKDTIKNEILLHLSIAKRGFVVQDNLVEIVDSIFYKLKTGLSMAISSHRVTLFKYGAVFHPYNKWSKRGECKLL